MKIADIHAHIFPDKLAEKASHSIGDFYGVSIEREANMHCLTAEDRLAGVTRCVVSNSATSAKQVFNANTFLAEAVRGHEGYLAFGTIYPGMDGYEATRTIRLSEKVDAADIPIIALTANAFAEDAKAAHDAGMNAHLSKPLDFNKLKNILARIKKNGSVSL